jgi:hypothetical protein
MKPNLTTVLLSVLITQTAGAAILTVNDIGDSGSGTLRAPWQQRLMTIRLTSRLQARLS